MTDNASAMGFERMETQLVREAVRCCADLYIEEVGRKALQHYRTDKGKQNQFIAEAWTFPLTVSMELLLTTENLQGLWNHLRENKALNEVVLATAVKLRGYYQAGDWGVLIANLAAGGSVLRSGQYSVVDDVASKPFATGATPEALLADNFWVVVVMLTSYMPLTGMPKTLQTIMQTPVADTVTGTTT